MTALVSALLTAGVVVSRSKPPLILPRCLTQKPLELPRKMSLIREPMSGRNSREADARIRSNVLRRFLQSPTTDQRMRRQPDVLLC